MAGHGHTAQGRGSAARCLDGGRSSSPPAPGGPSSGQIRPQFLQGCRRTALQVPAHTALLLKRRERGYPCCRRQSKRKKKRKEKRLHRAENRYVSTKAACCPGSLCSSPGRSPAGWRHRGELRAPMAIAQRCPRALCEGRRHPPGRALTETTGELIKRARTHAELNKYFTRKKKKKSQIKHIFVFF